MGPSVLIVDDHSGFRASARLLLEAEGFTVLGEATDGTSALEAARELRPELVLLDIELPDMDGFEVTRCLADESNRAAVILISSRDSSDYRTRLSKSKALGFIPKVDLSGTAIGALMAK